ncbi:endonuclease/exonuclease/phosphatase family protein [Flexithrix dorotheae]|uniref:endonuclease/exonuclease/phosphatase family protein n=1 Tax=Flexithrix dorotheae TaxID=70993 RepID=UPI00039CF250|nr:endonuclease/exonuclease/phosphatase family protein [Flexithrix dorotheae]
MQLFNILQKKSILIFYFFSVPFCLIGQDYQIGDSVQLVTRSQNIPAHPAAGNSSVHLRFKSGSTGKIKSFDSSIGWYNLEGNTVGGEMALGWITKTYIESVISSEDGNVDIDSVSISWCPPKGSPEIIHENRLRLATWNLENLHSEDGQSTYTGSRPSVIRKAEDYERLKCYIRMFNPDILAVQEVDGTEALNRIIDSDVYNVHVSSRLQGSLNGKQNTGFIWKKGLSVEIQPDFTALDVSGGGRLRYGARIDVTFKDKTIKLVSLHMKSGCFDNSMSGSSCETLMDQIPVLESWIDTAATKDEPFILLGDFNRRFNLDSDRVWSEIDDAEPANADLTTVTLNMPLSCRDNRYTEYIDHIVFDKKSFEWVDLSSFRQVNYRQADKADWDKISDHCPVVIEIWVE